MALGSPTPDDDTPTSDHKTVALTTSLAMEHLLEGRLRRYLAGGAPPGGLVILGLEPTRLEILQRADSSPEEALLGFVLPPRFSAIGVIAESVIARRAVRGHRSATLALAVARSGETVTRVASPGQDILSATRPHGWVLDACMRAVGRATDPPDRTSIELPLTLWLDRLMVEIIATHDHRPVDWERAVELCPVPDRWRSLDPRHLGATLASTVPAWSAMRRSAAQGSPGPVTIPHRWAEWMDEGMYARWCLGYFPDLGNLRADVEFLAPPDVAERVELAVQTALS